MKTTIRINDHITWVVPDPYDVYRLGCWKDEQVEEIISPKPKKDSILETIATLDFQFPELPQIKFPELGQPEDLPDMRSAEPVLAVLGGVLQAVLAVLGAFGAVFAESAASSFCWPGME